MSDPDPASGPLCNAPERDADLWVFGYGSLMWQPGFRAAEAVHARVTGYHRSFCIYSMHYRGTPRAPGLVLGLDRGGSCEGMAFRVDPADARRVRHYLRVRELVTGVYREAILPVTLLRGARPEVQAVGFIAERAHPAYAGDLPVEVEARLVRRARGLTGANLDYVLATARHLAAFGIRERKIERLTALLGPHLVAGGCIDAARTRGLARSAAQRPAHVVVPRLRLGDRKRFIYRRALNGG